LEKGWTEGTTSDFQNNQGNRTRVARLDLEPRRGQLVRIAVFEKLPESIFQTEIAVASEGNHCAIFVNLKIEGAGVGLHPFRFDARRPKFIGKLLHKDLSWQLGETPLTDRAYNFCGEDGGDRAAEIIWHFERAVPVVLVSLINEQGITSSFVDKLAGDLAGLAIVATVDEEAAWRITRTKGAEWSCFNGAVRLYWPFGRGAQQPRLHPLWLKSTMLSGSAEPSNASYRMRAQLRRTILGVSALSIREPELTRRLTREAREKRQDDLRATLEASKSADEYHAIAESYAEDNDRLRAELKEKEDRLSTLEDQVSELQLALRYLPQDDAAIPPDVDVEPDTVSGAVQIAMARLSDRLSFSSSIEHSVADLAPDAGPPQKILRYLERLHELAEARETGPLGKGVVEWLSERGVACSVESETVRNAGGRVWVVNGESITFDYHLKPSDAVSPDRCVRIYFDLVDRGAVRVGWIGRHPN
jgi:hypothetical protein